LPSQWYLNAKKKLFFIVNFIISLITFWTNKIY
jgi:hypothetical protein